MNVNNSQTENAEAKWLHPNEVLKLQRFKLRKKQLQARIKPNQNSSQDSSNRDSHPFVAGAAASKRSNPFLKNSNNKRFRKTESAENEESSDQTLFKLLHLNEANNSTRNIDQPTTFTNVLKYLEEPNEKPPEVVEVGKTWIPIDWTLKSKVRLMSSKAFAWNQKLKISEEASGITAFVRCLGSNCETTLDTSPNARFHQCCLYWQYPSLPWLSLFPRSINKTSKEASIASTSAIRESLQKTWCDSLRSLFQLVRTRQCPYFYVCANNFAVIFRAAGICGCIEMNAIVTPTTRGFRQLLRQENIDFSMPLKSKRTSDQTDESVTDAMQTSEYEDDDEAADEEWLQSMGINAEDIKQINYTQARMAQKSECEIDNSEQSLVFIKGTEVHGLYNFLLNSKSTISTTGPLAGIPPTLLSQIAFQGGTLSALKVKECKMRIDEVNYFSLEISGPILPHLIHNLCALHPADQSLIASFANLNSTLAFSKVKVAEKCEKENQVSSAFNVFGETNLSDCGLNPTILKHFCSSNTEHVTNFESLKYNVDTKTYTWL